MKRFVLGLVTLTVLLVGSFISQPRVALAACSPCVNDPITQKWLSLGGVDGFLGYPVADEARTPDGIGLYRYFQGGSIYWTSSTGAHEVHGAILQEWANIGWERSVLGYPVTDETGTPDGVGRYNQFQRGSIYWTPYTGAHEVHGAIGQYWANNGWERSSWGYPTSDEMAYGNDGSRVSYFYNGWITWYPNGSIDPGLTCWADCSSKF